MGVENFYRASAEDFEKIPGLPISYWVSNKIFACFKNKKIAEMIYGEGKNVTSNNEEFVRFIWEVSQKDIGVGRNWLLYAKGGAYRKWFGNIEHLVNWTADSRAFYKKNKVSRIIPEYLWYKEGITWTDITSSGTGFRYLPPNTTFDATGLSIFFNNATDLLPVLGLLNSNLIKTILPILNPTLHAQLIDIRSIPVHNNINRISEGMDRLIELSKLDWADLETSKEFGTNPLLRFRDFNIKLPKIYEDFRIENIKAIIEIQALEFKINEQINKVYDIEGEIKSEVSLKEITLACNPYYRYGVDAEESVENAKFPINQTIEDRLKADTMKEFISYAVGCMFGRYSLDKEGLILANAGDGIEEYMKQVQSPSFSPDESGILPLTEADDFTDDLPSQFYRFLRITFGEEHYHENLRFIEDSIGKTVRNYFLKDFFKDHVQRYKKRPIYWLVTSPKGTFQAMIYLHRYSKDTVGQILNDYVRPFEKKLESKIAECRHISTSSASGTKEKIQAQKDVDRFEKSLQEITEWDANILRPLALKRIELDLDDGVKVNYGKLGDILEKVKGLNA